MTVGERNIGMYIDWLIESFAIRDQLNIHIPVDATLICHSVIVPSIINKTLRYWNSPTCDSNSSPTKSMQSTFSS